MKNKLLQRITEYVENVEKTLEELSLKTQFIKDFLTDCTDTGGISGKEVTALTFTNKELKSMPKTFKNEFRANGCSAHITKRKSGKNNYCYEIRYRRNGYNISASSTNLTTAKERFIEALKQAQPHQLNAVPDTLNAFAEYYFTNFYAEKVKANTYANVKRVYNLHIKPHFGEIKIKKIMPALCKALVDKFQEDGRGRTAQEVYSIMSIIFRSAVVHGLIDRSPLAIVPAPKHQRVNGTVLTADEERLLLSADRADKRQSFAILLYTGLRPNELATAKLDGKFIVALNSKQKNGVVAYNKIPITPMLAPYITGDKLLLCSYKVLYPHLKRVLPNHALKDTRTTFATRCQQCGIPADVVRVYMGHSLGGVLGKSYTKFTDSYLYEQGQKLLYT